MKTLTVIDVLLRYDSPLIILAESDGKQKFIGVNYEDRDDGYAFYFAQPKKAALRPFLEGSYDLLHTITKRKTGTYRQGVGWAETGSTFATAPLKQIDQDILPDSGLFIPEPSPSPNVKDQEIHIDGRWGINDLRKFSDLIQDSYAFVYALSNQGSDSARKRVSNLFQKYPWRGGFSSVNFFDDLYTSIPPSERAAISSIHYASPGKITLNMDAEVAKLIRNLVLCMNDEDSKSENVYKEVHDWLKTRGWLGKASEEVDLDDRDKSELVSRLKLLATEYGLSKHGARVLELSSSDPLGAVKILLAYYRRLKGLADYVDTGKVQDLFV